MRGLLGLAALLAIAWALSEDRRRIPWRTVIAGVVLQWALALLLIVLPAGECGDLPAERRRDRIAERDRRPAPASCSAISAAAPLPFAETHPGASFILAFQALPLVLTISALASLLFYWGVLQRITGAFAWLLRRAMGIGGALALGAAVHVFVGMIEAPLLVRPYLARMQRGELFALMTCGMAGVAGTVMVIYAVVPGAAGAERAGQHPDRLGDQHAGRPRGGGAAGAVRSRRGGGGTPGHRGSAAQLRWTRW